MYSMKAVHVITELLNVFYKQEEKANQVQIVDDGDEEVGIQL